VRPWGSRRNLFAATRSATRRLQALRQVVEREDPSQLGSVSTGMKIPETKESISSMPRTASFSPQDYWTVIADSAIRAVTLLGALKLAYPHSP
jgi:hypothetical protein